MGETTAISWTDHTFNPWIGCTKVSEACRFCYAERENSFRKWNGGTWGPGAPRKITSAANWRKPLQWDEAANRAGVRRRVFCASLADVFDADVDDELRDRLFRLIDDTQNLDWLLLTKRPAEALRYFTRYRGMLDSYEAAVRRTQTSEFDAPIVGAEWPLPNVWLGVSVENQEAADQRIPILLEIPAAVRFLSMEPLLGAVEFSDVTKRSDAVSMLGRRALTGIDWIIAGGESGAAARPSHPDWFRSLREQCLAADVAFHFKQWGEWAPEGRGREVAIDRAGRVAASMSREDFPAGAQSSDGWTVMRRVGKTAAGRLLDGVEWNEFPRVRDIVARDGKTPAGVSIA